MANYKTFTAGSKKVGDFGFPYILKDAEYAQLKFELYKPSEITPVWLVFFFKSDKLSSVCALPQLQKDISTGGNFETNHIVKDADYDGMLFPQRR